MAGNTRFENISGFNATGLTTVQALSASEAHPNVLYFTSDNDLVFDGEVIFKVGAQKGIAHGLASLDANGKVPAQQLPGFVDDVIDIVPVYHDNGNIYRPQNQDGTLGTWDGADPNLASYQVNGGRYLDSTIFVNDFGGQHEIFLRFERDGNSYSLREVTSFDSSVIYVNVDDKKCYRSAAGGNEIVEISNSLALGENANSAYRGDRGKVAYDHAISMESGLEAAAQAGAANNNKQLYLIKTDENGKPTGVEKVTIAQLLASVGINTPATIEGNISALQSALQMELPDND